MWLRGYSRSLKLVPFKSLGAVSYLPYMVTLAVSVAVCEIFSAKEWCDLENRVRVRSRSLEMARFDRLGYRTVKKLWSYVKPFSSDTGTLRTDGRTDGRTVLLYQYRASAYWLKTVESAEYTCRSQQCNSTNSAVILPMEIKHVAAYYFLRTIMWRVDLRGLYDKVHETWHYV